MGKNWVQPLTNFVQNTLMECWKRMRKEIVYCSVAYSIHMYHEILTRDFENYHGECIEQDSFFK
jgi:hypothetical protein